MVATSTRKPYRRTRRRNSEWEHIRYQHYSYKEIIGWTSLAILIAVFSAMFFWKNDIVDKSWDMGKLTRPVEMLSKDTVKSEYPFSVETTKQKLILMSQVPLLAKPGDPLMLTRMKTGRYLICNRSLMSMAYSSLGDCRTIDHAQGEKFSQLLSAK